jgi:hypothetical protein
MKKLLVLALALAAAPLAAQADEISYTYVESGYAAVDLDLAFDGPELDFDGFQLRGSAAISDSLYVHGGYGSVTNDDAGFDLDFNVAQLGLGYRFGLSDRADLVGELGYIRQEFDAGSNGSVKADGGRVSVGVRALLADNFEGWAKGSYTDGGDFEGDFSGTVGALVKFNPTWGLVGEIEAGEDLTKYLIGVRASF